MNWLAYALALVVAFLFCWKAFLERPKNKTRQRIWRIGFIIATLSIVLGVLNFPRTDIHQPIERMNTLLDSLRMSIPSKDRPSDLDRLDAGMSSLRTFVGIFEILKTSNDLGFREHGMVGFRKALATVDYSVINALDSSDKASSYYGLSILCFMWALNLKLEIGEDSANVAYEYAEEYIDSALWYNRNDPNAWQILGSLFSVRGAFSSAIKCYDHALYINNKQPDLWRDRGDAMLEMRYPEDALRSYDSAFEYDGDTATLWSKRCNVMTSFGHSEEVVRCYDSVIKYDKGKFKAWNERGNALLKLKRYREAVLSYDKASELSSDYCTNAPSRGAALLGIGDTLGALLNFERALKNGCRTFSVWFGRAIVLIMMDSLESALASCDSAISINSSDAVIDVYVMTRKYILNEDSLSVRKNRGVLNIER